MPVEGQLPQYQCFKKVWALKIREIRDAEADGGNEVDLVFEEQKLYAPIRVTKKWVEDKNAESGGYYVVYADGYKSFSPAKAFEEGYARI